MDVSQALDPVGVTFTDPDDVKKYGDRVWVYDEAALIRLPVRRLIELEAALGMPLVDMMNGIRMRTVLGDLAGTWVAIHLEDPELAGPFDDFTPVIMLTKWRSVEPEGKEPSGTDTPAPLVSGSHEESLSGSTISDPTDTVALPTLPVSA